MDKTNYQEQVLSIEKKFSNLYKGMIKDMKQALIDHECCGITFCDPPYEIEIGGYENALPASTLALLNGKLYFVQGCTDEAELSLRGILLLKDEKEFETLDFEEEDEVLAKDTVGDHTVGPNDDINLRLVDLYKYIILNFEKIDNGCKPVAAPDAYDIYNKLCDDYNVSKTVSFKENKDKFEEQSEPEYYEHFDEDFVGFWDELQSYLENSMQKGIACSGEPPRYDVNNSDLSECSSWVIMNVSRRLLKDLDLPSDRRGLFYQFWESLWAPAFYAFGIEFAKTGLETFLRNNRDKFPELLDDLECYEADVMREADLEDTMTFSFRNNENCREFGGWNSYSSPYPLQFAFSKDKMVFLKSVYDDNLSLPMLCFWNSEVEELYLNGRVESVSESAFLGCKNLRLISVPQEEADKVRDMLPEELRHCVEPRRQTEDGWIVSEYSKIIFGCIETSGNVRRLPEGYNLIYRAILPDDVPIIVPSNSSFYALQFDYDKGTLIFEDDTVKVIPMYENDYRLFSEVVEKVIVPDGTLSKYRQEPWAEMMGDNLVEWTKDQIDDYLKLPRQPRKTTGGGFGKFLEAVLSSGLEEDTAQDNQDIAEKDAAKVSFIPRSARRKLVFDDSCYVTEFEPEDSYNVPVDIPDGTYHFCNMGEEIVSKQLKGIRTMNDLLTQISSLWDKLTAGDEYEHPYLEQVDLATSGKKKYLDCYFGS